MELTLISACVQKSMGGFCLGLMLDEDQLLNAVQKMFPVSFNPFPHLFSMACVWFCFLVLVFGSRIQLKEDLLENVSLGVCNKWLPF